jgi:hypothetical protein
MPARRCYARQSLSSRFESLSTTAHGVCSCFSDSRDIWALIPKYNCAALATLIDFGHGDSGKNQTSSDCR